MQQTLIQIGNSQGIIIPKHIRDKLKIKKGQKIDLVHDQQIDGVILKPSQPKQSKKTDPEFKEWLDTFLKENSEILDELALR